MSLDEQLIKAVRRCSMNSEEYKKNIEDIQSLLVQGASANAVDYSWACNQTVLFWAAENGKKEVVKLLLKYGADIDHSGFLGILSIKGESISTPLHAAIEKSHEEIAIFLIENGANIHAKDRYGETPLHGAAFRGLGNLVKLLLDRGANVHIEVSRKFTPLHRAAHSCADPQTVRLLLEHGSNVHAKDNGGKTPLWYCLVDQDIFTLKESPESFFLLLLFGADVNREDDSAQKRINNTPKFKNCLTAFEQIKAMPRLGKLIEVNIKKEGVKAIAEYVEAIPHLGGLIKAVVPHLDKLIEANIEKEGAKAIAECINNRAKGQELIEEFQTITEKYGSDEQLSFVPEYLLDFVEHITMKFLKSHIDEKTMVSYLHESIGNIEVTKKEGIVLKHLPYNASEKIVSYLKNDTKKNVLLALNKKVDEFLSELKNVCKMPSAALSESQSEAVPSQSRCCIS